jgi:methyl-accepting chemotaxis protein
MFSHLKPLLALGGRVSIKASRLADLEGQIAAISKAQAVIEFGLDGRILTANENFLKVMGYTLEEVRGQHHSLFVDPAHRSSDEYRRFWEKLGRGEYDAAQYMRLGKGGREVWIQASYNPIFDTRGKPFKVVKYATDITASVLQAAENGRIKTALDKASASVMLADDNFNIIYVNEAAQKLFRSAENDFRRDLPQFDSARIVGANIDVFHRNPSRQRQILAGLQSSHAAEVRVGGRVMRVVASPVVNASGSRFGTLVEWFDRTQEVLAEEQVAAIVRRALDGDLTERLPTEDKTGFFAKLTDGLNQLLDNMSQLVRQIQAAAREVSRGADEISQGNLNLSQRTEEQSSSLEETASSMEEMTSTVKQNADNASQANQLASAARDQAEKGGAVVGRAVSAMDGINDSAKKIAEIITVIDGIAFQTNLLALNAAVEAARAGEQGRGFAVVATEVRSLASRSATAAKEIKDLIQDSVKKVEDGSVLVTQSGQTLEQIVTSVKKVSDIVGEIAAASREQSSGIEQVNKAVTQMDEMTQQNASLVEQATAASQSMAGQARELDRLMQQYRLPGSGAAERAATAEAARPAASNAGRSAAGASKRPPHAVAATGRKLRVAAGGQAGEWEEF